MTFETVLKCLCKGQKIILTKRNTNIYYGRKDSVPLQIFIEYMDFSFTLSAIYDNIIVDLGDKIKIYQ